MSDATDFMNPDHEPGEFDGVEHRLRRALHHEAQRVRPSERLDHILAASGRGTTGAPGGPPGRPRWLSPLGAAAAVALIAGVVWTVTEPDEPQRPPVGITTTAPADTASPSPTSPPTSSAPTTGSTSPTSSSTPASQRAALPVYFVGPVGGDRAVFRLFREFLPGTLPPAASDADKARASLDLAMDAQPFSNTDGYLQPWSGTAVEGVSVTPGLITVTLSNAGSPGVDDREVARVAVQSLVWTAQAAVGKGTIPVTFRIADGSKALFGQFAAAQTYNRPPSAESYQDLAPIWISQPGRDAVLPASKPVVVKGEATVFEATVSWRLQRGTTEVKKGFATASIGAPGRGGYSFSLGTLAPGDYTIRVFELSMEDGTKVNAEKSVGFSVK